MIVRYGPINWRDLPSIDRYHSVRHKPRVWDPLLKSVGTHGFINPVVCNANKGGIVVTYGQSRAAVARELDIPLPAVIADYDDRFPMYRQLNSVDEIAELWYDPDIVRPFIKLTLGKKLWLSHHSRVPINENGDHF